MRFLGSLILLLLGSMCTISLLHAQGGGFDRLSSLQSGGGFGSGGGSSSKRDSLQKRDKFADSITIYYRNFDSTRNRTIDSSINDFYTRFPLPYTFYHLGNYGTAAQSFLFNPIMKAGFDAGFHQYDVYKYTIENTRFYQTTRPYSELSYLIGSKSEQLLSILHTQNRKSNFNFGLEYRFSNAPGSLKNQNASHNNVRFNTHYQTKNRRYEFFLIMLSNKSSSSENGGLIDKTKIDSLALNDPYELDTRMGKAGVVVRNPFNTNVFTGNLYKENVFLFKHHYDFGQQDSIVTDSNTFKIFYPRFRVEHTLNLTNQSFNFFDVAVDSIRYKTYFNYTAHTGVSINFNDQWRNLQNEFSLITFPEKNNQSQFFKASIALQNLKGTFDSTSTSNFYNLYSSAEYRNRTRNQIWDVEAAGKLYVNGLNAGDYSALVSLRRQLSKKIGYLNIGFQNVNRSPSFILNPLSSFPVKNSGNYNKENSIKILGTYDNPLKEFKLSGEYFIVNNFMYFDSFFTARQESTLFNVLHLAAEKKIKLSKHWNWYAEVHLQQTTGNPPINIPFLFTRNRLAFEGNFYTNLYLSTGFEIRYNSSYKADNYSPMVGQFFYQNTTNINNRPEINAFLNFRIKSFKGFVRVENLQSISNSNGTFGFNQRNLMANDYLGTGLWTRLGIWWNFVN